MKHLKLFLYALALIMAFVSCGGDDDDEGGSGGGGTSSNNTNANVVTTNSAVTRLEFPKVKGGSNNLIIVHSTNTYGINYAIEWDCTKKSQRWSCYEMTPENSVSNWNRNNWKYETSNQWAMLQLSQSTYADPFQPDPDLDPLYRTELSDYKGIGYQRGHICPSADRLCSKEANEQTFYLSNMHPQLSGFNTGVWEKMEEQLRTWNRNDFRDVLYVCKGGTIDTPNYVLTTTNTGLIVPKYFFMAILCKNSDKSSDGYKALGFWVEHKANNDTKLINYVVNIDKLEELTGIDFFCNLPDDIENKVESLSKESVARAWGLK